MAGPGWSSMASYAMWMKSAAWRWVCRPWAAVRVKIEKLGVGQRDIDLHIGGVVIAPGDYVYADNNGVIVSKRPLL